MKKVLLMVLLLSTFLLHAQTTQKGIVVELNSGKNPVAGVEIIFFEAQPTTTDNIGAFSLNFSKKQTGDKITYKTIFKKGYEIVNEKEVQTARLAGDKLKIILCIQGIIAQKKAEYYDISIKAITAGHDIQIQKLNKLLDEAKINEEYFILETRKLQDEMANAQKYADELAEKFARTNFDDVNDLYKRAFNQFTQGEIIKAIKILEEKDLIKEAQKIGVEEKKIANLRNEADLREQENKARRDTLMKTIKLKGDLLVMHMEYEKADTNYNQLWLLDTTNVENTYNYASFLQDRKQYDKALLFYAKLLEMPGAESWQIANTHCRKGEIYQETGKFEVALAAYENSEKAYSDLLKQEPGYLFYKSNLAISNQHLGDLYQTQGDFKEALEYLLKSNQLSEEIYLDNLNEESIKTDLTNSYGRMGGIYQAQGDFIKAFEYFLKYNQFAEELYLSNPKAEGNNVNLAISYSRLGDIYQEQGDLSKAIEYHEKEMAFFEKLNLSNHRSENLKNRLAISYFEIGDINQVQGNLTKALDYFQKSNLLNEELHRDNPRNENFKNTLAVCVERIGEIYQAKGDFAAAFEYFQKFNQLFEELWRDNNRNESSKINLGISYSKLGEIYRLQGDFAKAIEYYQKFNQVNEDLYLDNPRSVRNKDLLSTSYQYLGTIYQLQGNFTKALEYFQKNLKLEEELYADNPVSENFKDGLANSYGKLGTIYKAQGDFTKALDYYQKFNQVFEELYLGNPQNARNKELLSVSYQYLGSVYQLQGDFTKALGYFQKDLKLSEELFKDNPSSENLKNGLAISCEKLGETYLQQGDFIRAHEYFMKCNQLAEELYRNNMQNIELYRELAISYYKLAQVYAATDKIEEAILFYQKSGEIYLKLIEKTQSKSFIQVYEQSIKPEIEKLQSGDYLVYKKIDAIFANIESQKVNAEKIKSEKEIIELYKELWAKNAKNNQLAYRYLSAYGNLSWYLLFEKQFAESEHSVLEALKIADQNGLTDKTKWVYTNLASSLLFQGKYEDAKKIYLELKDQEYVLDKTKTFKYFFLQDLDELEKAGITHPDVAKIQKLLNE
jgi:tetratricopeptide (TPR) repeat protein